MIKLLKFSMIILVSSVILSATVLYIQKPWKPKFSKDQIHKMQMVSVYCTVAKNLGKYGEKDGAGYFYIRFNGKDRTDGIMAAIYDEPLSDTNPCVTGGTLEDFMVESIKHMGSNGVLRVDHGPYIHPVSTERYRVIESPDDPVVTYVLQNLQSP